MSVQPSTAMSTYRGYILDPFQTKAIEAIEEGASVLVSAPTGTGKTLVADYVIERSFRAGEQVIYTAPIKALSNQKFKEFKRLLGEENVGILTGDVVINPDAAVLIMTTEIFRNLLHQSPGRLAGVTYTIFDEIHYIDDPARGSVWEESLIFMPPHMRFLGLSATIPNAGELARWASSVQGREVRVIEHFERAVPLEHRLFESGQGFCTFRQLERRFKRYAKRLGYTESHRLAGDFPPTTHLDLLKALSRDYLPCLFFAFSRRRCEAHAHQLAEEHSFLSAAEQSRVRKVIAEQIARHPYSGTRRLKDLEALVLKGIAYHHAGLLPLAKDVVEELFEQKLIYVLYCTETFAVGLNFPCKTVCFDAVSKWDGTTFRPLTNREYFQMAGRAGRRGIDDQGYVFTLVDMNYFSPNEFPSMREDEVEPLQSRFSLSYNTVLNLVGHYTEEEIEEILRKNFASFQTDTERSRLEKELRSLENTRSDYMGCELMDTGRCPLQYLKKEQKIIALQKQIERRLKDNGRGAKPLRRSLQALKDELKGVKGAECSAEALSRCRAMAGEYRRRLRRQAALTRSLQQLSPANVYISEFQEKKALLAALDYLRDDVLTSRGQFATHINGHELVITELFFRGVFHDWHEDEINALCVSLDYEPRKGEGRARQRAFDEGPVRRVLALIQAMEETYLGYSAVQLSLHLADAAAAWSKGAHFSQVLQGLAVDEGDVVYAFRRAIDILRQVRNAAREDAALSARLRAAIERMDRDEVSILL